MNPKSKNSLNSFPLNESISVTPRFTRSVRIDRDDYDAFLKGFIYTPSCAALLKDMANFVRNGERAFTWTGPFGTGKSSSVLFLQALLSGNSSVRRKVKALCGEDYDTIRKGFKAGKNGWEVVSVVGRRESPLTTLSKALGLPETMKNENDIILFCEQKIKNGIDGILIAIDEMGKFLEHAAFSGGDIYPFQQLAELAARGTGRIVLLGVLHQNFAEYAKRVSRDVQGEWNKIQGRFHDFSYNLGREESIAMLGQAITSRNTPPASFITNTEKVISTITKNREITDLNYLKEILIDAYPLHPVTTLLLGPFSRHSFSQNQRSLFGFLNSVETGGFQEFLERAESGNVYTPVMFWDYLAYNFEPVIMTSSLSHRWALALENIHRSDKQGGDKPHRDVIKIVALMELFSEYSGVRAELDVLKASFLSYSQNSIDKIISDLEKWKILLYRKHMEAYSLFSGSDFDLDNALATAESHFLQVDFSLIKEMADLKPVIAKRHHLETGTIRWYKADMSIRQELSSTLANYSLGKDSAGLFLFVISDEYGLERNSIEDELSSIQYKNFPVLIGFLQNDSHFFPILKEIQLLLWIEHNNSEISGDPVARYEVESRKQYLAGRVKESITSSIMAVRWHYWGLNKEYKAEGKSANVIASELADRIYDKSPIIHNEIANRIKPSGNTNAAMKQLLTLYGEFSGSTPTGY